MENRRENQQQHFSDYMHEIPKTPARNLGLSEQNYIPVSPATPFPFATPWIPYDDGKIEGLVDISGKDASD
jgi:hypothetical protein